MPNKTQTNTTYSKHCIKFVVPILKGCMHYCINLNFKMFYYKNLIGYTSILELLA